MIIRMTHKGPAQAVVCPLLGLMSYDAELIYAKP